MTERTAIDESLNLMIDNIKGGITQPFLIAIKEAFMKPSVGRIVHYVAYGTPGGEFPSGVCRAAIITEVQVFPKDAEGPRPAVDELVGLCVLNPTGQFFNRGLVEDQETKKPGTWHWPERVE